MRRAPRRRRRRPTRRRRGARAHGARRRAPSAPASAGWLPCSAGAPVRVDLRADRLLERALRLTGPCTGSRATNTQPTRAPACRRSAGPRRTATGTRRGTPGTSRCDRIVRPDLVGDAEHERVAAADGARRRGTSSLWATASSNSATSDGRSGGRTWRRRRRSSMSSGYSSMKAQHGVVELVEAGHRPTFGRDVRTVDDDQVGAVDLRQGHVCVRRFGRAVGRAGARQRQASSDRRRPPASSDRHRHRRVGARDPSGAVGLRGRDPDQPVRGVRRATRPTRPSRRVHPRRQRHQPATPTRGPGSSAASSTTAASTRAFAEESGALGHRVPGADVLALLSGDVRPEMVRRSTPCCRGLRRRRASPTTSSQRRRDRRRAPRSPR